MVASLEQSQCSSMGVSSWHNSGGTVRWAANQCVVQEGPKDCLTEVALKVFAADVASAKVGRVVPGACHTDSFTFSGPE